MEIDCWFNYRVTPCIAGHGWKQLLHIIRNRAQRLIYIAVAGTKRFGGILMHSSKAQSRKR